MGNIQGLVVADIFTPKPKTMKSGNGFWSNLSDFCAGLSVLLFPYSPRLTVLFLLLHFVFSLVISRRKPMKLSLVHPVLWACAGFYVMHVISLLNTDNLIHGLKDLETKMALLLLPLAAVLLPRSRYERESFMRHIMLSGLISILVACIYSISVFARTGETGSFFYDGFSFFMHPTYYTMFLNLVLIIHLDGSLVLGATRQKLYEKARPAITAFLIAGIVLASSRAGMVVAIATTAGFLVYRWFRSRDRHWLKQTGFLLVTSAVLFLTSVAVNPGSRYSVLLREVLGVRQPAGLVDEHKVDVNPVSHRKLLWGVTFELCLDNPLGVGCGDIQDVLVDAYAKTGFDKAVLVRYNPHNQYLQSWLALGLPGLFLSLLMMFPVLGRYRNAVLLVFILMVFGLNAVFESVLEVQRGVLMYALSVLYFTYPGTDQGHAPNT
jgi:O-antigen ligase